MQKLHIRHSRSPRPSQRSRTGSLGDILTNTQSTLRSPRLTPRSPYARAGRSMSICTQSIPLPGQNITHTGRNSRKDSVNSLGEHFSSLVNLSSQVVIEPHEGV